MAYYISEKCIGCGACARECPVHAVDGDLKARHIINAKRCVDCGVCGMSCPAGAVSDGEGRVCQRVPKAERQKPQINTRKCSACQICITFCPAKALSISPPRFKGDVQAWCELSAPENCVGCGRCAAECPLKAIKMSGGKRG